MLKLKTSFYFFVLFGLLFFASCTNQKSIASKLYTPQIQTFYSAPDFDTVFFSIVTASIPKQHIVNSYFFGTFRVQAHEHTFNTSLIRAYVSEFSDVLEGFFVLPAHFKHAVDTITIFLQSRQNEILSTHTIYLKSNQVHFLSSNTKSLWTAPFFYINQSYILKKNYEQLFYSTANNSHRNQVCCDSRCVFFPESLGTYNFFRDSISPDTIFSCVVVPNSFPKMNLPSQLLANLTIICPSLPIDSLLSTTIGPKLELDKFWLKTTSNNEIQAKDAISAFYSRIEQANIQFTNSCSLGIHTDKGFSYVLFGPPFLIQKNNIYETWYYSSDTNDLKKTMQFMYSPDLCETSHVIEDKLYLENMNRALLYWQKGQKFNLQSF